MQNLFVVAVIFYIMGTAGYYDSLFFQRNSLQQLGFWLEGVGFLCQTLLIVWTYAKTGHMPVNNLYETLSLVAWAIVGVHLAISVKFKIKILGIYAAPLAVLILLVAAQFPRDPVQPLNLLKGVWLTTHVITVFAGDAALALAVAARAARIRRSRSRALSCTQADDWIRWRESPDRASSFGRQTSRDRACRSK